MSDLVARARAFAVDEHRRIDHRRKYNGQPYEVHLAEVADLVAAVTDDPETIAAAWLHDIVEDTPVTLNDVADAFGPAIAALVGELTDVSRPGDGNRAVRKAIDRSHLAAASSRAKTVKLADLVDNAGDICRFDARFGRVYLAEMAALLEVLGDGHPTLLANAEKTRAHWSARLAAAPPADGTESRSPRRESADVRSVRKLLDGFTAADLVEPLLVVDEIELDGLERSEHLDDRRIAVVGLRSGRRLVGYVETTAREDAGPGHRGRREIADDQIIDVGASIPVVVHVLTRYDHAFVREGDRIQGVLARADLEKPIGRMWLFGIVMLVELDFLQRIRALWPDGGWEACLSPGRLDKARQLQAERLRRGQPSDLLDCLQLADKGQILIADHDVLREWGHRSRKAAKAALQDLQSLRNHLAHSQAVVDLHWHLIARLSIRFDDGMTERDARASEEVARDLLLGTP
mgnify:FL=1